MVVFAVGAEHKADLIAQTIYERYERYAKRRRREDGMPHMTIDDGFQEHTEVVMAENLPMLNWMLAAMSMEDKDSPYPISMKRIVEEVRLIGVCITDPATSSLRYTNGGPDIRVFKLQGDVDVHEVFRGVTKDGLSKSVPPNHRLYFYIKPVKVNFPAGQKEVTMKFTLNGKKDIMMVRYNKGYTWKCFPVSKPMGEHIHYVKEGLQVFDNCLCPDPSNPDEMKEYLFDLRGTVMQLGHMRNNYGQQNSRQIMIQDDVCTNANEIQRARAVEVYVEYNAPPALPMYYQENNEEDK
jgi:hypothetical protein